VCPGCGAYAPDIDPATGAYQPGYHLPAGHSEFAPTGQAAPARYVPAGFTPTEPSAADEDPPESPLGPPSIAPTLHHGRAARRRQMERWKKHRRRAGVAAAVALFGGGVTGAAMQSHGSAKGGTVAGSPHDTVTLQSLQSLQSSNSRTGGPSSADGHNAAAPGHHTAATPLHGTAAGTPSLPTVRATHGVADSGGTAPIAGGPLSVQAAHIQPVPSTSATVPSSGTRGTSTGSTTGTDTGSTTDTNAGSTTGTNAGSTDPGGSTTANPSAGSTTNSTPPPATTSPSQPPSQQSGLCVLVLCIG
jgi:hypothetical protein